MLVCSTSLTPSWLDSLRIPIASSSTSRSPTSSAGLLATVVYWVTYVDRWNEQTVAKQDQVRQFVQNGQLEFINGGWCMSDEAAPYYVDMVDQQTIGHQFLLQNFGPAAIPKTGWQIDPFGHSRTMGTLFALMGMNSWFFGRIDWQVLQHVLFDYHY